MGFLDDTQGQPDNQASPRQTENKFNKQYRPEHEARTIRGSYWLSKKKKRKKEEVHTELSHAGRNDRQLIKSLLLP